MSTLPEKPSSEKKYSLEYDLFPMLIKKRNVGSYLVKKEMIDVGTPELYKKEQLLLK